MIKYLLILINSIAIYVFGLLNNNTAVVVSGTFPTTAEAGKVFSGEIKITKDNISGFGRLTLEVPNGFTVKSVSDSLYEFSFAENKAKWMWNELPDEEEITVRVILVAAESTVGQNTVNAKFAYIDENNEKQFAEMQAVQINVTSAQAGTTASLQNKADTLENVTAPSHVEPQGNVIVERTIKKGESAGEFIIAVKIKKGLTKGFARYSDDAYENVSAKTLKTDGGSFSISEGKIKFVWVNVPEKDELEIEYLLSGVSSRIITLNGEYSYLENNQSKKTKLAAETLNIELPGDSKDKKENFTKNAAPSKSINSERPAGLKREGNTNFEVQLGAFTNKKVSAYILKQKFNINEAIRSEMHGGYFKFMTGSHREYEQARNHREKIKAGNGVQSAFVVAYNGATRVTVQEALMITSQKWIK